MLTDSHYHGQESSQVTHHVLCPQLFELSLIYSRFVITTYWTRIFLNRWNRETKSTRNRILQLPHRRFTGKRFLNQKEKAIREIENSILFISV